MDRIKITMLGGSAAGKTCYMIAMYKVMNFGIELEGFLLKSSNIDDNARFAELWKLLRSKGPNRWPASTVGETNTYKFDFFYSNQHVVSFDWFDYRGGALEDYENAHDLKALRERLLETSCLLVCVSGEYLAEDLDLDAYEKTYVSGINQLITDTQSICEKNVPPAVVIVVTKSDLCHTCPEDELIEKVKTMFAPLFAEEARWLVMVCPVTLGEGLSSDLLKGEIRPVNVHLPIVFSLYAELMRQGWIIAKSRKQYLEELERASEGFLAALFKRKFITERERDIDILDGQIRHIEDHVRRISRRINMKDKVHVFFDGKRIQINDFFR